MTLAPRVGVLLLLVAALGLGCESQRATHTKRCIRVIDGDTILLEGDERVRLIGLDAPELHHPSKPVQYFAREASDFVERMLEGREVRLEYGQTRQDRYGRTLAYVFIGDTLVNKLVIEEGYGHALVKYPFEYRAEFEAAQRTARTEHRGLWAESTGR